MAVAKTKYATVEDDPFGGEGLTVMERSNDDPIIWHERVLQVSRSREDKRAVFLTASPFSPLYRFPCRSFYPGKYENKLRY